MNRYISIKDETSMKETLSVLKKYAELITENFLSRIMTHLSSWEFHEIMHNGWWFDYTSEHHYASSGSFRFFVDIELPYLEEVICKLQKIDNSIYSGSILDRRPYRMICIENKRAIIDQLAIEKLEKLFLIKIKNGNDKVLSFLRATKKI